jgi:hypothetical protein
MDFNTKYTVEIFMQGKSRAKSREMLAASQTFSPQNFNTIEI